MAGSRRAWRSSAAVVSPDVTRRLRAVHDGAVGEHHGDLTALVGVRLRLVVVDAGGVEIVRLFIPAEGLDQLIFDRGARRQLVHQLIVQRIAGGVATGRLQAAQHTGSAREQLLRRQLAVGRHSLQIVLPQAANPAAVRFARRRGHIVADQRLYRRFIGADAEDIGGDFKHVQQRLVIQVVGGKPCRSTAPCGDR